jgi:acyl carrier protein
MTPDLIMTHLQAVIGEVFGVVPASVSRETTAFDIPGWDSVKHVYLLLEVERRLGTRLPTDAAFGLANVGELADLLAKQLKTDAR